MGRHTEEEGENLFASEDVGEEPAVDGVKDKEGREGKALGGRRWRWRRGRQDRYLRSTPPLVEGKTFQGDRSPEPGLINKLTC